MRTKEEILDIDAREMTESAFNNLTKLRTLEVLIDIRDILENRLQDISEPIKHIANNHGGNF